MEREEGDGVTEAGKRLGVKDGGVMTGGGLGLFGGFVRGSARSFSRWVVEGWLEVLQSSCSSRLLRGDPGTPLARNIETFWPGQSLPPESRWKGCQVFAR